MHYSLMLTLACLIYLFVLILIYFPKKNLIYLRCKIYKILLIYTFLITIIEFISIKLITNGNNYGMILFITRWYMALLWAILIFVYFTVATNSNRNITLKELLKEY